MTKYSTEYEIILITRILLWSFRLALSMITISMTHYYLVYPSETVQKKLTYEYCACGWVTPAVTSLDTVWPWPKHKQ